MNNNATVPQELFGQIYSSLIKPEHHLLIIKIIGQILQVHFKVHVLKSTVNASKMSSAEYEVVESIMLSSPQPNQDIPLFNLLSHPAGRVYQKGNDYWPNNAYHPLVPVVLQTQSSDNNSTSTSNSTTISSSSDASSSSNTIDNTIDIDNDRTAAASSSSSSDSQLPKTKTKSKSKPPKNCNFALTANKNTKGEWVINKSHLQHDATCPTKHSQYTIN
jgi:hypothetical protein